MKKVHIEYYLSNLKEDISPLVIILQKGLNIVPFKDFLNIDILNITDSKYLELFQKFIDNQNLETLKYELETLDKHYREYTKLYNEQDIELETILERLTNLVNYYTSLIDNRNVINIKDFFYQYTVNYYILKTYYETINNFTLLFEDKVQIENNQSSIEIYLIDAELNVSEFGATLSRLSRSYNALKKLMEEKVDDLQVIKIESGSLLTKSFGNDKLISTLKTIFQKIIEFIPKLKSKNQVDRVKELLELVEKSAEVTIKLEDMGINTAVSKDALKKALGHVTGNLYAIAKKCDKIKLDDEFYDVREGIKLTSEEYRELEAKENSEESSNL